MGVATRNQQDVDLVEKGFGEAPRLFVGGIPMRITESELGGYFSQFGNVKEVVVRRGFGFVSFHDNESTNIALNISQEVGHIIAGRKVDVKRAKRDGRGKDPPLPKRCESYDPVRLFVGGIPMDVDSSQLKGYFEGYGKVDQAVIQFDRNNGQSRGFGFVTFVMPHSVDMCINDYHKHRVHGKWIEVKRCVPPNDPNVLHRPDWFSQQKSSQSSNGAEKIETMPSTPSSIPTKAFEWPEWRSPWDAHVPEVPKGVADPWFPYPSEKETFHSFYTPYEDDHGSYFSHNTKPRPVESDRAVRRPPPQQREGFNGVFDVHSTMGMHTLNDMVPTRSSTEEFIPFDGYPLRSGDIPRDPWTAKINRQNDLFNDHELSVIFDAIKTCFED